MKRAILLSGGIDSMSLAYLLKPEYAITFDYGQKAARAEIVAATAYCKAVELDHEVIRIDCSALGSGVMRDPSHAARAILNAAILEAPTPEWWPFRNQLLVTLAAARAVTLGMTELYVGAVLSDREHRDGLPEFYTTMDRLLALQEGELRLFAPYVNIEAAELVRSSAIPLAILAWSHSCHRGNLACGECRGCLKHRAVFEDVFGS